MVEYVTMGRREAAELLERFVAGTPQRLAELRVEVADSGGPAPHELDLSRGSLGPLWEWAVPRVAWRAGFVPAPSGLPGPREPVGPLEPDDALPVWFDARVNDGWQLSAPTLWLVDGLARYLGETLVREVPGVRWATGRSRVRSYAFRNHVVLEGLPRDDAEEPMWSVTILVARALRGDPPSRGPATLTDLVDVWTSAG